ncbi:Ejaculatory bulb-specific protein 3 [Lucilia cuprina]|nr:Ejaculatory bulb-specific protein 3 [Lucilia cuprina]
MTPKMKLAIVVVAFMAIAAVTAEEKYTTKFDNIDVDEILKSDRLFTNYYKCLIDEGKCTPDGRELKKTLPDALQTGCKKCSDKQRENSDKVVRFIIDNKPEEWKVLQQKYDPENVYYNKYKDEAAARGIKI